MKMHNPPHPGEVLRELCIKPMALSVTRAAEALGVTRKTLSAILNGRASITLKWQSGSPWRLTPLLKAGSTSSHNMIFGWPKRNESS